MNINPCPIHADQVLRRITHCTVNVTGQTIRVVGSGLSPNGMAFCPRGMLSTALLDNIISIDKKKQQVTVQAGARVQQVLYVQATVVHLACLYSTLLSCQGSKIVKPQQVSRRYKSQGRTNVKAVQLSRPCGGKALQVSRFSLCRT